MSEQSKPVRSELLRMASIWLELIRCKIIIVNIYYVWFSKISVSPTIQSPLNEGTKSALVSHAGQYSELKQIIEIKIWEDDCGGRKYDDRFIKQFKLNVLKFETISSR